MSKRSKKGRKGSKSNLDDELSDDAIAAVLAKGEEFSREYVPSALEEDEPSELEPGDSVIGSGVGLSSDASASAVATVAPEASGVLSESDGPYESVDAVIVKKPAAKTDWKAMAPPFAAGLVVGAAVASGVLLTVGGGGQAVTPTPPQRTAPRVAIQPAAPPANAEELKELLAKVRVKAPKFEEAGGLLGGGRQVTVLVKNDSGLVLRSATFNAKLTLAAFDDSVLAEEGLVAKFSPVLGIGEEQTVTIAAPAGGPIATAPINGRPVSLTAKLVDLDWQGKDAE